MDAKELRERMQASLDSPQPGWYGWDKIMAAIWPEIENAIEDAWQQGYHEGYNEGYGNG